MTNSLFRCVAVACFIVAIEAGPKISTDVISVFKDLRHLRENGKDVSYEKAPKSIGTVPKTIKSGKELFAAVEKLLIENGVSDPKIESMFGYRSYEGLVNSKTSVTDITEEDTELTLINYSRIEVRIGVDVKVIPILTLRKKGKGTPTGTATPSVNVTPSGNITPTGTASPSGNVTPSGNITPTGTASPSGNVTPTGSASSSVIITTSVISKKKPSQKIRLPARAATLTEICLALLSSTSIRVPKITRIVAHNKGSKDRLISTKCDMTNDKAISTANLTLFITVDPTHQPRLFLNGDEYKIDDDDKYLPAFDEDEPSGLSIWKQMMTYSNNNATQVFNDNGIEIHPSDTPFNLIDTKSLHIITEATNEITVNGPESDVKKEVPVGKYVHWLKLLSDLMSFKEYQSIKSIKGNDLYITIDKDGIANVQTSNKSDIFETSKLGELTVSNEM